MSRLLIRWGLGKSLEEIAVRPESLNFCRRRLSFLCF